MRRVNNVMGKKYLRESLERGHIYVIAKLKYYALLFISD